MKELSDQKLMGGDSLSFHRQREGPGFSRGGGKERSSKGTSGDKMGYPLGRWDAAGIFQNCGGGAAISREGE